VTDEFGYQVVGRAVLDHGLNPAFGLLGDANMMPIVHAVDRGLSYFAARHEAGAICMATGYAMACGRVGFATLTRGPGLSNAITALVSAVRDHVPLVVFAGAAHLDDPHGPQSIDQDAMLAGTGVRHIEVTSAAALPGSVATAVELAEAERRPVVFSVPTTLLESAASEESVVTTPRRTEPGHTTRADPALVRRAAERLAEARRPVVLVGRGGTGAESVSMARTLAERVGALLATTLPASGLFHGDPYDLGFVGGYATGTVRELAADADTVLALGAGLNPYTTDRGRLLADAFVIQVDHNAQALGRHWPSDLPIAGALESVLPELLSTLPDAPAAERGYRTAAVAARIAATRWAAGYPDGGDAAGLDPRTVLRAVDQRLGERRRVVVDVGAFSTFPCQVMRVFRPGQLLPCFGFGSIGLALPTALGVAVGAPDDSVACVVGDGGLLLSLPEMESVARLGIPLTIVVINDSSYGAEVHTLRKHGVPDDLARFPATDFAGVARSLGLDGLTLRSDADLSRLPVSLDNLTRPLLIDARVTPNVVADKFQ
jgi:acetolactate synthase-1/2/3 large subunit